VQRYENINETELFLILPQFMERKSNIVIKNKRAEFDYELIEKFVAGIVLCGTEIKSIRAGKASLVDSYCFFSDKELYVKGLHIAEYWWGNLQNHDPRRDRKLLLTTKELSKLSRKSKEKGLTIIASRLFISEKGYAKLTIALARGKKAYDKRESIKDKDLKREMSRNQS
jgi:SsrA-binding protein